ncbi:Wzz/FepE/Etk N-terminal domain-containing protein [Marinoscillum furvescens]|uniref:Putative tyrosine kinase-like protein n=1 Tax=Marinoscillum furvescens DSM 4134 TaxID=1122208 RepID=A0A3D9L6B7_MARFU|nr:Wzz/FepE/Etk N-terminal domain-containing protein [Marinoscillum furvescens]REE01644.1 putative tyrosine kinase-like protein [Marinoscillum furvescens DSM 4134]
MDQKKNSFVKEDEIDLIELAKLIWSRRLFIVKVTSAFVVLGLIIAFTSPVEYKTSCTLIPEAINEPGKLGGSLGGLASLAGVDLGGLSNGSQGINPALYQSVSRSTPFLLTLMRQEYFFSEVGDTLSIYDYYMEHYEVGMFGWILAIPGKLIGLLRPSADIEGVSMKSVDSVALSLTKAEQSIVDNLHSRVFVEMDWDLNVVKIEVEMQDPVVAAQMAQFTQNYITNYVTDYSISKSMQQLESIEEQYLDRKSAFEQAQYRLAAFRDRNQNVQTARARSEEERLQSEYNLSFNVYNQLAQQKEAIKLQIKEKTPVFTILEPVKVPVEKSKPKRMIIFAAYVVAGIFIGFLYITILYVRNE